MPQSVQNRSLNVLRGEIDGRISHLEEYGVTDVDKAIKEELSRLSDRIHSLMIAEHRLAVSSSPIIDFLIVDVVKTENYRTIAKKVFVDLMQNEKPKCIFVKSKAYRDGKPSPKWVCEYLDNGNVSIFCPAWEIQQPLEMTFDELYEYWCNRNLIDFFFVKDNTDPPYEFAKQRVS